MLETFLRAELLRIPMQHWSEYFPAQVAVLRFLETTHKKNIELTGAGFDEEGPYLRGRGIDWFADVLWQREDVLELVDTIMTEVVLDIKNRPSDFRHTPQEVRINSTLAAELEKLIIEQASLAFQ
jgi:hypothetical protein